MATVFDSIRPVQMPDPIEQQGRLYQLMALQDRAETGQLQREQMRRALAKEGRLAELAQRYGGDQAQLEQGLRQSGFFGEANQIAEARRKAMVDQATIDEKKAQTGLHGATATWRTAQVKVQEIEAKQKASGMLAQQFGSVLANPTPAAAEQLLASLEQQGADTAGMRAELQQAGDVRKWADMQMRRGVAADVQLREDRQRWEAQLVEARSRDQMAETGRHNQATEAVARGNLGIAGARLGLERGNAARPVYQQTENGLVMLPGKVSPGEVPVGVPITAADGTPLGKPPKALPGPAMNEIGKAGTALENTSRLRNTFKDEFGGNTIMGGIENTVRRMAGDSTGQAQWWQDLAMIDNQIRNDLFGSALTATELAAWNAAAINPRMAPSEIRKNLERRSEIEARAASKLARAYEAGGYNKKQITELLGSGADLLTTPAPPASGASNRPQPARASTPAAFDAPPDPRQFAGKVIRDEAGNRLRSDGTQWVRVQ